MSLVYELPVGRNRKFLANVPGVVDQVIGGWQFSIINTALSAQPVNLRAWSGSVPTAFQTVGNLAEWRGGEAFRPNVLGPVVADESGRSVDNYFNTANVALPTDPSRPFGNAGRNIARALPMNQLDLGLFKNFRLAEGEHEAAVPLGDVQRPESHQLHRAEWRPRQCELRNHPRHVSGAADSVRAEVDVLGGGGWAGGTA